MPESYSERCQASSNAKDYTTYCGMNLMLDEVVANVTCVLESTGLIENTIVVLASDNGGSSAIPGSSVPFRGHKYDFSRGGVSANAYVFSKLLSSDVRGTSYSGLMHVSDWLPTLMTVATQGAWSGSYSGAALDGVNQWDAMRYKLASPRSEIVHYAYANDVTSGSYQVGVYKLDYSISLQPVDYPDTVTDSGEGEPYFECSTPTYALSASEILSSILPLSGSDASSLLLLSLSVFLFLVVVVAGLQLLTLIDKRKGDFESFGGTKDNF